MEAACMCGHGHSHAPDHEHQQDFNELKGAGSGRLRAVFSVDYQDAITKCHHLSDVVIQFPASSEVEQGLFVFTHP